MELRAFVAEQIPDQESLAKVFGCKGSEEWSVFCFESPPKGMKIRVSREGNAWLILTVTNNNKEGQADIEAALKLIPDLKEVPFPINYRGWIYSHR